MKYDSRLIYFFKKHNIYNEEVFTYLENNSSLLDYNDPNQRCFIGCCYKLDKQGKLIKIHLFLPNVDSDATMLINIHEIIHGIENYFKLGKIFNKDITVEALPILYEKIYIEENKLQKYGKYLDNLIANKKEKSYQFALKIREELLKNYHYDMPKMTKLVKKLSKKYK